MDGRKQSSSNVSAKKPRKRVIAVDGQVGYCGGREVFLGFGRAELLSRLSFADVLDETRGTGYQRRFSKDHSLAFKRYIQEPGATTIPLTFNLRKSKPQRWRVERQLNGKGTLKLPDDGRPVMAQVDCQHRLGHLRESSIVFAFMAFLGLSVEEEMQIFRDINGKAKGLSSSLLDYTDATLARDGLAVAHPAIALALQLQEDPDSPWLHRLDLGGERTNGMKRIASLRTMQKAIRRFQRESDCDIEDVGTVGRQLIDFWKAVIRVYPDEWSQPRKHLLCKGIGVYALMSLAGEFVAEAKARNRIVDYDYFIEKLSDFADKIDWRNKGAMKGFGGSSGADRAFELIKAVRLNALQELHGQ